MSNSGHYNTKKKDETLEREKRKAIKIRDLQDKSYEEQLSMPANSIYTERKSEN